MVDSCRSGSPPELQLALTSWPEDKNALRPLTGFELAAVWAANPSGMGTIPVGDGLGVAGTAGGGGVPPREQSATACCFTRTRRARHSALRSSCHECVHTKPGGDPMHPSIPGHISVRAKAFASGVPRALWKTRENQKSRTRIRFHEIGSRLRLTTLLRAMPFCATPKAVSA